MTTDHTITFTRLPIPKPPFYFSATGYGFTECGRDSGEAYNNVLQSARAERKGE